ncbi:hypothetical protein MTY66_61550 (plasmid) [Mycolicibacterium sp. TY66]|uniref:hypothetical protein n=1 Tax=unclassified Mycolicibacterium TaxID=2636767 RepID=UPI001BB424B8|nr:MULTISPECIES: hypothetical protein [unclassified Mycolicibacterium]BCI84530.1 hypothetical protein MTY66_61550 [Mycolicibacterium sp. TY66]BCJ84760.1 hypothetical protein MTY81_61330 [Mycolicibacterium sp. TY81]
MDNNKPEYVLVVRPLAEQQPDQSWKAWYPKADWSVSAATKPAALQEVRDEFERRLTAGLADDEPDAGLLAQHLASPIPGVYAIEHDTYMRMRSGPNFQQRLDAYIAELDAKAQ